MHQLSYHHVNPSGPRLPLLLLPRLGAAWCVSADATIYATTGTSHLRRSKKKWNVDDANDREHAWQLTADRMTVHSRSSSVGLRTAQPIFNKLRRARRSMVSFRSSYQGELSTMHASRCVDALSTPTNVRTPRAKSQDKIDL